MSTLTDEDRDFLRRPLHGFLTVAAGPVPPQPRPVWFEATAQGTIELFTDPASAKVPRLQRDPRASLVVAAPATERERWVAVSGRADIESDGAPELVERLAARYWDLDDPARKDDLAGLREGTWLRIVLHPDKATRLDF
ncbi:pyridoxamine 5'-phosphate oxidase family protein [Saccharopolyspora flava]|uniref:Pyridoxamine 5'-phosphate oxidase n=1 Tax=Saccharopolyspora flava TaxID=95161 RepID=A0A1I6RTP8_9PSEU|nr:pyridoxamine 5'-phosphate oxidase family protein [Saccharopolyspora flava]SFS68016.1 Pyridoxamine 5'-phosphate oxidase [Saccharopolyspora flava]